jgi:hypothetical protein
LAATTIDPSAAAAAALTHMGWLAVQLGVGWALLCSESWSSPSTLTRGPWYGGSRDARDGEFCIDKTRGHNKSQISCTFVCWFKISVLRETNRISFLFLCSMFFWSVVEILAVWWQS